MSGAAPALTRRLRSLVPDVVGIDRVERSIECAQPIPGRRHLLYRRRLPRVAMPGAILRPDHRGRLAASHERRGGSIPHARSAATRRGSSASSVLPAGALARPCPHRHRSHWGCASTHSPTSATLWSRATSTPHPCAGRRRPAIGRSADSLESCCPTPITVGACTCVTR